MHPSHALFALVLACACTPRPPATTDTGPASTSDATDSASVTSAHTSVTPTSNAPTDTGALPDMGLPAEPCNLTLVFGMPSPLPETTLPWARYRHNCTATQIAERVPHLRLYEQRDDTISQSTTAVAITSDCLVVEWEVTARALGFIFTRSDNPTDNPFLRWTEVQLYTPGLGWAIALVAEAPDVWIQAQPQTPECPGDAVVPVPN